MSAYVYPFLSTYRKRKDYWVDNKFDLQKVIDRISGRVIEFAGPSINGYYFLNRVTFSRSIEITNIDKTVTLYSKLDIKIGDHQIDQSIDITSMNLANGSVGVALLSCLTIAPEDMFKGDANLDEIVPLVNKEVDTLTTNPGVSPTYSLRAIFLRKASKFINVNGLLVAEQLSKREVRYAKALGFKLRAYNGVDQDKDGTYYQSLVLQRIK